jgi:hypothetical protein
MLDTIAVLADKLAALSADELVGALFFGLVLSIGMSRLYVIFRRNQADRFAILCGGFVACILSMMVAMDRPGREAGQRWEPMSENEQWMSESHLVAEAYFAAHPDAADPGPGLPPSPAPWGPPPGRGPWHGWPHHGPPGWDD